MWLRKLLVVGVAVLMLQLGLVSLSQAAPPESGPVYHRYQTCGYQYCGYHQYHHYGYKSDDRVYHHNRYRSYHYSHSTYYPRSHYYRSYRYNYSHPCPRHTSSHTRYCGGYYYCR